MATASGSLSPNKLTGMEITVMESQYIRIHFAFGKACTRRRDHIHEINMPAMVDADAWAPWRHTNHPHPLSLVN